MRSLLLLFFLIITCSSSLGQIQENELKIRPLNSIYINLLGDASLISINYDRLYRLSPSFMISSKLGLGYNESFRISFFGIKPPWNKYTTIPHHITGNIGENRVFFEFGFGGTAIFGKTTQPYITYPIVGYRIMPYKSNRLNFRIFAQVPLTRKYIVDDIIFSPLGSSLGISF